MMNIICSGLTYPCNCSIRRIFSIANFVSSGLRSIWLRTSWSSSFSLPFSSTKYESTVSFPSTSDSSLWILSSLKRSIIFPLCVFCSRCCTCRLDHLCWYLQKDKHSTSGVHQSNCKVQIQRCVNHFCSIFPVETLLCLFLHHIGREKFRAGCTYQGIELLHFRSHLFGGSFKRLFSSQGTSQQHLHSFNLTMDIIPKNSIH